MSNSYYIDSCIFLGTLFKDANTDSCKRCISRINNGVYIGYISPFVTGEMINSILYEENIRDEKKPNLLHAIVDMLVSSNVKNFVPSNQDAGKSWTKGACRYKSSFDVSWLKIKRYLI